MLPSDIATSDPKFDYICFFANINILCGEIGVTIISPHDKQIVHLSAEIGVLWLSVYIGKHMRL